MPAEFLKSLSEPIPIQETLCSGLAVFPEPNGICRVFGWTDLPTQFSEEKAAQTSVERVLVLRMIIPTAALAEFVKAAAHNLLMSG